MLAIDRLTKIYGDGTQALAGISLSVPKGEILVLLGASGCGKTSLLRIIAGLEHATAGTVSLDGHRITEPQAAVGLVFQEPRLLPWRSAEHNVRLALPRTRRAKNLDGLFAQLGLAPWRSSYPKALSLGMQRRVALARALANEPRVLVLDEPFVSLDDASAADLRALVVEAVDAAGMSVLMVTHNVAEALGIADRLLLVSKRPATLVADVRLDRPRCYRDRVWAEATRQDLAARHPEVIAE